MTNKKQTIQDVQRKILEIMKFIDRLCRENGIVYYIMGGTALGAVRHGGFIPWDDDLDIFMTPTNYEKFKKAFSLDNNPDYVLQEWKIVDDFLEYAKVRMNGTTFIENNFRDRRDMHHGIYVDIMILHKCPNDILEQRILYLESKFVTLVGLSERNWRPKSLLQRLALLMVRTLPNKQLSRCFYKHIYQQDRLQDDFAFCYFITKANFRQGVFGREIFQQPTDIQFEDTILMGPTNINKYLEIRFGNYLKLPSKSQQDASVHAEIFDTEVGFQEFFPNSRLLEKTGEKR